MNLDVRNKCEIYSVDKWGLDPLYHMLISIIHKLQELPDIPHSYFYKNHPISKVTIVGFVTALIHHETFLSMSITDTSGTITCNLMRETENELKLYPQIELGEMYRVKGSIKYSEYNKEIEISISHIELCKDVNIEIEHILEVIKYTRTYYDNPFIVNDNENTDTSQNYMKIMNKIKIIIFNYCYLNKTNIINSDNSEISDCIKRIRRIESVSEIKRLSINYLNQLTKQSFLEYDKNNSNYIFRYYDLINYTYNLFQKEKKLTIDMIHDRISSDFSLSKSDRDFFSNVLINLFIDNGIVFESGENEYSFVE